MRGTIVGTGEETASIGFEARLGEEEGHVRLHWTSTNRWRGEKRQCENRISLTTRSQPFGGRRWWFVCPRTGQLGTALEALGMRERAITRLREAAFAYIELPGGGRGPPCPELIIIGKNRRLFYRRDLIG
jgi:hypothetical protein